MFIYIILILSMLTTNIIQKNKKDKRILLFFIIFIIIIQSIRSFSVGTDLQTYLYYFDRNANLSFQEIISNENYEYLYHLLNKIIYLFHGNFRTILIFTSMIFYIPLYFMIEKNSNDYLFSLLLIITIGIFTFTFSGIRQTIAMGISIIAFEKIKKKELKNFIILVCFAILFHKSSFIFFFAYPIYHIKLTKNKLFLFFMIGLIIFTFRFEILTFLTAIYDFNYSVIYTGAYNFLILLIIFLILSIFIIFTTDKQKFGSLINLLCFSIIIQFFSSYSTIVMRFNYYFIIYLAILIPQIIYVIKDLKLKIMLKTIIILFFTINYITSLKGGALGTYPYKVMFMNQIYEIHYVFKVGWLG